MEELKQILKDFKWTFENMGTPHTPDHFNIPANAIQQLESIINTNTELLLTDEEIEEAHKMSYGETLSEEIWEGIGFKIGMIEARSRIMKRTNALRLKHEEEMVAFAEWIRTEEWYQAASREQWCKMDEDFRYANTTELLELYRSSADRDKV